MRFLRLLAFLCAACGCAWAGNFGVSPIRVDFDRGTRTAVIEVSNDDERKLTFQVKLFEWTQDAAGLDQYAESQDLIWFPQILAIDPKQKRVVRVGMKQPVEVAREKTYRLFIEELPPVGEAPKGAEVRVLLRFGVPLFIAPTTPSRKVEITSIEPRPGKVAAAIRGEGTQSVRFESLRVKRGDAVVGEAQGWYVLAGATHVFEVPIDPARCPLAGPLELEATAEGLSIKRAFDAPPSLCARP